MPTYIDPKLALQALMPQQVGDVIPLPITPGPNAGPTNQSADYIGGRYTNPQVEPIPSDTHLQWIQNMARRLYQTLPK